MFSKYFESHPAVGLIILALLIPIVKIISMLF
jgi:hypothetical protein